MGKTPEANKRATIKYRKNNIDQVAFDVPKGQKDVIKRIATDRGKSLAQYLIDLIEQDSGIKIR